MDIPFGCPQYKLSNIAMLSLLQFAIARNEQNPTTDMSARCNRISIIQRDEQASTTDMTCLYPRPFKAANNPNHRYGSASANTH